MVAWARPIRDRECPGGAMPATADRDVADRCARGTGRDGTSHLDAAGFTLLELLISLTLLTPAVIGVAIVAVNLIQYLVGAEIYTYKGTITGNLPIAVNFGTEENPIPILTRQIVIFSVG